MLTIISSTNRKDSYTLKLSKLYKIELDNLNIKNQIFDLKLLPQNFIFKNFSDKTKEFDNIVRKFIEKSEKFIIVSPEYHGSYPGILKSFIDCIGNEKLKYKKIGLVGVSTGRLGNARGLDHLTILFNHLKANVFYYKPKFSLIDKILEKNEIKERVKDHIDEFIKF
jgi:NAD(P)H-dependent FMN reductase